MTAEARAAIRFLVLPNLPLPMLPTYAVIAAAAADLLPFHRRRALGLWPVPLADPLVVRPAATSLLALLGWALGPAAAPRVGAPRVADRVPACQRAGATVTCRLRCWEPNDGPVPRSVVASPGPRSAWSMGIRSRTFDSGHDTWRPNPSSEFVSLPSWTSRWNDGDHGVALKSPSTIRRPPCATLHRAAALSDRSRLLARAGVVGESVPKNTAAIAPSSDGIVISTADAPNARSRGWPTPVTATRLSTTART